MIGECDGIRDLLDLYVAGSLEPDKRKMVEVHLGECASCRKEMIFSRALCSMVTRKETKGEGYHLESETLTELAFTPHSLEAQVRNRALEHIAGCRQCRESFETLRSVAGGSETEEDVAVGKVGWAGLGALAAWLTRPKVPAWIAVACAAMAILVIIRGVAPIRRSPDHGTPFAISGYVEFDFAPDFGDTHPMQLRAPSAPDAFPEIPVNKLTLDKSKAPAELVIQRPSRLANVSLADIELYRITDEGFPLMASWREVGLSFGSDPISLVIPPGVLREGMYLIVLKRSSASRDHDDVAHLFRLQVSTLPASD